jgi:uncharacterized protein YkwD
MMRWTIPFLLCLLAGTLGAEEAENSPPAHLVQTSLQWMQSPDPERRKAAYRTVHLLGREALPVFEKALRAALRHHERRLSDVLDSKGNPYRELGEVFPELRSERARVMKLLRTDWKKSPGKVRMLRAELEKVEQLHQRAIRLARSDTGEIDRKVEDVATALVELHRELALFEAGDRSPADRPRHERIRASLGESFDGESHLRSKEHLSAIRAEDTRITTARSHNGNRAWADRAQKDFAGLLNEKRAAMGLAPFLLDEPLSVAASEHSREMRQHGFFSHTSPVEGKRSPGDRARRAGFRGRFSGENIFMGAAAHTAAYNGWFGSDGHRFIMFASGPNVVGLGPVGKYWTLMTGKR